jgi:hypothetical protein
MEQKKLSFESGVGVGTVLAPGSYRIEGEMMLLRVRLDGTPLVCLIDEQRRVREILRVTAVEPASVPSGGKVAFDASRSAENGDCLESEEERLKYAEAIEPIAGRFEASVQRFAADSRACLRKMAAILDRRNVRLTCEFRTDGPAGLKAYLVREFFKRTVREERGFKILLLLSQVIAANGGGQPERLEMMSLEQQKRLLRDFMDLLKVAGHKRLDPRIFEEIYAKFNDQEYVKLSRGGTGFYIKPLYIQEMQEMKTQMLNTNNSNYIEQLFSNSLRDSLDFLYENTLAYLKALAIVRLYAKSNKKERGGDSKTIEHILRDLIAFRPGWIKAATPAHGMTA